MEQTLLLNATYEPLKVVHWQKAMTLWCQGKVEVISVYDREVRSVSFSFKLPSVIRLLRYIKIKRNIDYVPFSRANIYAQFLIEAAAVGVAGGLVGLLLTGLGVLSVGLLFEPEIARLAHLDLSLVAMTLLVAIVATVLAAFYPTWRAAQVQPAWQLKSN